LQVIWLIICIIKLCIFYKNFCVDEKDSFLYVLGTYSSCFCFLLSLYIVTGCLLQDPPDTHLCSCQTNYRPITPAGASGYSTQEVGCRSCHLADTRHRG